MLSEIIIVMGFIPKVGQYYYRMCRGKFRVYIKNPETSMGDDYVCDCFTREEAAKKVKELNKW